MSQPVAYERFKHLHAQGCFVMPNAWDGASAVIFKNAGFQALGTSSAAIAFALGRHDGAHAVSLADSVANGTLMAGLTDLPINGDLEDGYGPAPQDCVDTVNAAIAGGLAGLGIEDTTADPAHPIHDFDMAVARMRAAATAAQGRILLTGRTDNFLHGRADLDDTLRRLEAFEKAGADVLFAPGLSDPDDIRRVVTAVDLPVSVLALPNAPTVAQMGEIGVARISVGGTLAWVAYGAAVEAARELLGSGTYGFHAVASPGRAAVRSALGA
jgi:2-methylisocitrate lyase-like PEP mutase family enzyme